MMVDLIYPQPWEAVFEKESGRFMIVQDRCCFAYVEWEYAYGYEEPDSSDWAVARVMAAAPELLEALEEIVKEYCENPDNGRTLRWAIDGAKEAIAKAKGEE